MQSQAVHLVQAPAGLVPPRAAAAGGVRALGWALSAVGAPPRSLFADIGGVPTAPVDSAARDGARAWRAMAATVLRRLPPLLAALSAAGALDASAVVDAGSEPGALATPASAQAGTRAAHGYRATHPKETLSPRRGAPLRPGVLIEELPDAGAAEPEAPPAADPVPATLAAALFLDSGREPLDAPWADAAIGDASRALLSCLASACGLPHGRARGSAMPGGGPAHRGEPGTAGRERAAGATLAVQDAAAGAGRGAGVAAGSGGEEFKAAAANSATDGTAALPSSSRTPAELRRVRNTVTRAPDGSAQTDPDEESAAPSCAQAESSGAHEALAGVMDSTAQQLVAALLRPAAMRLHRVLAPAPESTREGARVAPQRGARLSSSQQGLQGCAGALLSAWQRPPFAAWCARAERHGPGDNCSPWSGAQHASWHACWGFLAQGQCIDSTCYPKKKNPKSQTQSRRCGQARTCTSARAPRSSWPRWCAC